MYYLKYLKDDKVFKTHICGSYRNDGCKLRGMQYRKALEFGLFDEFDSVLDKVAKEGYHG